MELYTALNDNDAKHSLRARWQGHSFMPMSYGYALHVFSYNFFSWRNFFKTLSTKNGQFVNKNYVIKLIGHRAGLGENKYLLILASLT